MGLALYYKSSRVSCVRIPTAALIGRRMMKCCVLRPCAAAIWTLLSLYSDLPLLLLASLHRHKRTNGNGVKPSNAKRAQTRHKTKQINKNTRVEEEAIARCVMTAPVAGDAEPSPSKWALTCAVAVLAVNFAPHTGHATSRSCSCCVWVRAARTGCRCANCTMPLRRGFAAASAPPVRAPAASAQGSAVCLAGTAARVSSAASPPPDGFCR